MTYKYRVKALGRGKTVPRDVVHNLAVEADTEIARLKEEKAGNLKAAEYWKDNYDRLQAQHAQEISEARALLDEACDIVKSLSSGTLTPLGERDVKVWGRGLATRIRAAKEERG